MSSTYETLEIANLRRFYTETNWFMRLFLPSALKRALENPQSSSFAIYKAADTRLFRFFSWFVDNLTWYPIGFYNKTCLEAWDSMRDAGLLDSENAEGNWDVVINHSNPLSAAKHFNLMHFIILNEPLVQTNLKSFIKHTNSPYLIQVLECVAQVGLLTGDNSQSNYDHVPKVCKDHNLVQLLQDFKWRQSLTGIWTKDNAQAMFDAMIATPAPYRLYEAATRSNYTYSALDFVAMAGHDDPRKVMRCFNRLQPLLQGELASLVRAVVVQQENPEYLTTALVRLHDAGLLNDEDATAIVNSLVQYRYVLCFNDETEHSWNSMPAHLLTRLHWNAILALCAQHHDNPVEGIRAFNAYVVREVLLGATPEPGTGTRRAIVINTRQSTHTASVHKSASESATKLWARYGHHLRGSHLDFILNSNLNLILNKITTWVNALPDGDLRHDAAKRCMARLQQPGSEFIDPESGISTQQLLALCWLAIHDDNARTGSLDDAKLLLIEGLYEIQRGYNHSGAGIDNNHPKDLMICPPGSFNKLPEKLSGIHPDVQMIFITPETATLKLLAVVQEEVINYLVSMTNPENSAAFVAFLDLLNQVNQFGAEAIWKKIKPGVASRLFEEFHSLYKNKEDPDFISFIGYGEFTPLKTLPSFQKALFASKGYQQYCSDSLRHSGLFSGMVRQSDKAAEKDRKAEAMEWCNALAKD